MGAFDLAINTVGGLSEVAVNAAKAGVCVGLGPLDDDETFDDAVDGIQKGLLKIGDSSERSD